MQIISLMCNIRLALYFNYSIIQQSIYTNSSIGQMSVTTLVHEQIELVNIISLSEMRLQKNFTIIRQRLNAHDNKFDQFAQLMSIMQKSFETTILQSEQKSKTKSFSLEKQIDDLRKQLETLKNSHQILHNVVNKNTKQIETIEKTHLDTKMQIEEEIGMLKQQLKLHEIHIDDLKVQDQRLDQQLHTKQTKLEVQRVIKIMHILQEKNAGIEGDLKIHQYKLQKMEILSEKAERMQGKKDVEILKQIDQRVKREVKLSLKNGGSTSGPESTLKNKVFESNLLNKSSPYQNDNFNDQTQEVKENLNSKTNSRVCRPSSMIFSMQDADSSVRNLIRIQVQQPMNALTEKIKNLQSNYKFVNEHLKSIKNEVEKEKTTPDGIKQKIAEIKPQLIKLWAKFDTLQDRISYNEKKMDQKSKIINELVSQQKQNNWTKMDEKVKMMQTEFYATFKQIKLKLQSKVNTSDYEKFCMVLDEKLKQMNQLIFLKSDKIEVKKALLFLQSKIKEIILVISEDQENQKDALLTKKQIKCISCDKEIEKFNGTVSNFKGNWDSMPWKDHPPQMLGRFGMTSYGSLSKKLKRLDAQDLPVLKKKAQNNSGSINNGGYSP